MVMPFSNILSGHDAHLLKFGSSLNNVFRENHPYKIKIKASSPRDNHNPIRSHIKHAVTFKLFKTGLSYYS